jgi:hypothetical protein
MSPAFPTRASSELDALFEKYTQGISAHSR